MGRRHLVISDRQRSTAAGSERGDLFADVSGIYDLEYLRIFSELMFVLEENYVGTLNGEQLTAPPGSAGT